MVRLAKGAVYLSDFRITLPGSEMVTLTGQTIDKLIHAGDSDAALLYLYILKTHGHKTSSEAAIALNKSKGWVASAMANLSRLGLVCLDESAGDVNTEGDSGSGTAGDSAKTPFEAPRQYTEHEVKNEIMSGSDFSIVVDETQRRLGKILSPDDLLRLYGIYDNLRLPPEVILQLITHCIKESSTNGDGRAPSIRYIEKAAFTWEREGIFTLERAEEYLKALEERKSIRGEIKKVLHIRDREFSATEKRYIDSWIEMGFEPDAIAIAYDRTIVKTGGLSWPYMDGIMKNWHNKGLSKANQIIEKDSGSRQNGSGAASSQGGWRDSNKSTQKHGEPNQKEMERMQRLLNKTKEENED